MRSKIDAGEYKFRLFGKLKGIQRNFVSAIRAGLFPV
jgi:hypothetical protein